MKEHWAWPTDKDNSRNDQNSDTQNNPNQNNHSNQPQQTHQNSQPAQNNNGGYAQNNQNNQHTQNYNNGGNNSGGYSKGNNNGGNNSNNSNGGNYKAANFRHKENPFRFIEKDGSTRRESKTQYYDDVETLLKIQIDDVRYFGARFFQMANTATNLMRNYDMILQLGVFNSTEYKASIGVIVQPRDAIIISLQINDLIHQRRDFVEFYKRGKVVTSDRMETKTKVGFAIQRKPDGTFVLSVVSYDDRDQIQHRVDLAIDIYHIIELHILLKQYPTSTINSKFNNAIANESLKRILIRLQDIEDKGAEANAIKASSHHDTYNNGIVSQDNMSKMMMSNVQPEYQDDVPEEISDPYKVSLPFNHDDLDSSATVSIMHDNNPIKQNIDILDTPLDNISNTVNAETDAKENVPGAEAKKMLMGAFGDGDEDDVQTGHPEPIIEEIVNVEPIKEPKVIQPEVVEECVQVENDNVLPATNEPEIVVEPIKEVIENEPVAESTIKKLIDTVINNPESIVEPEPEIESIIEKVIEPMLDEVIESIEPIVEPIIEEIVEEIEPIIEQVEEVIEPIIEEAVQPIIPPIVEEEVIESIEEPVQATNPATTYDDAIDTIPDSTANSKISDQPGIVQTDVPNTDLIPTIDYNTDTFINSKLFSFLKSKNALEFSESGMIRLNINNNSDLVNMLFTELNNSLVRVHLNFTDSISPSLIFLTLNTSTDAFNHMVHSLNLDVIHGIYKLFMIIFKVPPNNVDGLIQGGKQLSDAIVKKSLLERVSSLLQIHYEALLVYDATYAEYFKLKKELYAKEA